LINIQRKLDGKYSETGQLPAKAKFGGFVANTCHTYTEGPYCGLPPQWGCAVNGRAITAVLIDQSRSFVNLQFGMFTG